MKDQGPDGAVQLEGIPFEVRWGARATSSRVGTCVEIKFTARSSTRRLLDGVAMPVPYCSTVSERRRHRRDAPDALVDFHTGHDLLR